MSPLTFRRILLLNATFSLASGILMVVFREQLARNLGLADPILLLVVGFWLVVGTALVITDFGILELIGIRSLPHPREQSA